MRSFPFILVGHMILASNTLAVVSGSPAFPEPPAFISFPADASVADITQPPYGAVGDGSTDCTAAIQKALDDKKRLIYFPKGTYLISETLRWGDKQKRQIFQGASSKETIIKLKDACPGFDSPNKPKELIWTGTFPPQSFRNGIRNLTIDTGKENPGAIGLRFYANNQGSMHDVTIRSGDGKGVIGLDLGYTGDQGPCLLRNIRIYGFDTGISTRKGSAGVVMEFVRLENQNLVGLDNVDQPLSIRGLVSVNGVTAIENKGGALLVLIDSTLEGSGAASGKPAVVNDTGFLGRNVKVQGYSNAVSGKKSQAAPVGDIEEWTSFPVLSLFSSPSKTMNLPIEETPEVVWDDPATWVSAVAGGGTPLEVTNEKGVKEILQNYADSFQKAIDSGATTVYFPVGNWPMQGDIHIRGNVRRIIGLESSLGKFSNSTWIVEDGAAPVVVIERIDGIYSKWNITHKSKRTLVLSCNTGGEGVYGTEKGAGKLFIEDMCARSWIFKGGQIWARQLNPEGGYTKIPDVPRGTFDQSYDKILNDGAVLWVLGIKSEGDGTILTNLNGAKTELLGGFIYANKAYRPEKQWVVNNDSSVSFSLVEAVIRKAPFDPIFETRKGQTKILKKGGAPGRGGGSLVVLFTGYE